MNTLNFVNIKVVSVNIIPIHYNYNVFSWICNNYIIFDFGLEVKKILKT